MNGNSKKNYFYFAFIALIFAADRVTKIIILNIFKTSDFATIKINSFLNFSLVWNDGIAFGLFSLEKNFSYNILTSIIILIAIYIIFLAYKSSNLLEKISYLMIAGGASGNIFDRLYYSSVVDFIDITINNFHWFIFNVADIFITLGIVILLIREFLNKKYE